MNIIIEGAPGVGKTNLVKKLIKTLENFGGFYTQEIRETGVRVGFLIEDYKGHMGILAHKDSSSNIRIGPYGINLNTLENLGVTSIFEAIKTSDYIIVDEIDRMELVSDKFKKAIMAALNSPKPLIATTIKEPDPFIDEIKKRPDVKLYEITPANRERLDNDILRYLKNNKEWFMDCLFCKIAKGEIPSDKVYEDDKIIAVRDINPVAPVHILVVPKEHLEMELNVEVKDSSFLGELVYKAKELAKREGISESGYRLVFNIGDHSGRHFDHLHLHLIGRKPLGPISS